MDLKLIKNIPNRLVQIFDYSPLKNRLAKWDNNVISLNFIWDKSGGTSAGPHQGELEEFCTLKYENVEMTCLSFHKNGRLLASGSNDGRIFLWNTDPIVQREVLNLDKDEQPLKVVAVETTPDEPRSPLSILSGHSESIGKVIFNSKHLFSCSQDGTVRVWSVEAPAESVENNTCLQVINCPDYPRLQPRNEERLDSEGNIAEEKPTVLHMACSDKYLCLGCSNGIVQVWSFRAVETEPLQLVFEQSINQCVWMVQISPDNSLLCAGDKNGWITLWNIQTKEFITMFKHPLVENIFSAYFSGDNKFLVTTAMLSLQIWDITEKKLVSYNKDVITTAPSILSGNELLIHNMNGIPRFQVYYITPLSITTAEQIEAIDMISETFTTVVRLGSNKPGVNSALKNIILRLTEEKAELQQQQIKLAKENKEIELNKPPERLKKHFPNDTIKNCIPLLYVYDCKTTSRCPDQTLIDKLVSLFERSRHYEGVCNYNKEITNFRLNMGYNGYHHCSCGKRSSACDYWLEDTKYVTNSLCVHYLESHWDDIPEKEREKLKDLFTNKNVGADQTQQT